MENDGYYIGLLEMDYYDEDRTSREYSFYVYSNIKHWKDVFMLGIL